MAKSTLEMHRSFLAEVREQRQAIADEDRRLETVEKYHFDIVSKLSAKSSVPAVDASPTHRAEHNSAVDEEKIDFSNIKRYDACKMALQQLGGQQKTAVVARWLLDRGYVTESEERVFYNAIYTAMNRKKDIFRKLKGGRWEPIEQPSNP